MDLAHKLIGSLLIFSSSCMSIEKFADVTGGEIIYGRKEIKTRDPNNNGVGEMVEFYFEGKQIGRYNDLDQNGIPDKIFFNGDNTIYVPKENFNYKNFSKKPIKEVVGFGPKEGGGYRFVGFYARDKREYILKGGYFTNGDSKPENFFWGENYEIEYIPKEDKTKLSNL